MRQMLGVLGLVLALGGCATMAEKGVLDDHRGGEGGDKSGSAHPIRDSAHQALDRQSAVPTGYGLYSYVVTKSPNENSRRLLKAIFATTGSADEAMIARENLNLILIPVKNAGEAGQALASARELPDATSLAVMHKLYDYGHAAWLIGLVCQPRRGEAVMAACKSAAPLGPLLVTSNRPIGEASPADQKILLVNLEDANAAAIEEIAAAYRRQILRKDFADRAELDGWRLGALNLILDAANLLPGISKAYAGGN